MVLSVTAIRYALNGVKADTESRLRTPILNFFPPFFKLCHARHGAHQPKARADSATLRRSAFLLGNEEEADMNLPSSFLITWMTENILGIFLALAWIFLFPKSTSKDAAIGFTAATVIGMVIVEFAVLRSGDIRTSVDSVVENLVAATTMTILGPAYIAIIGTVLAKFFRRQLPTRTVFCSMAVVATTLLLFGGWYAIHRLGN